MSSVAYSPEVRGTDWAVLLREQWPQVLVSLASVSIMAAYGSAYGILNPAVALLLAIGWEAINLKGIADSEKVSSGWGRFWSYALIGVAAITGVIWGVLYVLSLEAVGFDPRSVFGDRSWGLIVAITHIIPLSATTLCSSALHVIRRHEEKASVAQRIADARRREEEQRLVEAERQRSIEAVEAKKAARLAELQIEAEAERQRLALANEAQRLEDARQIERVRAKRQLSVERQQSVQLNVSDERQSGVNPQPEAELTREEKIALAKTLTLIDGVSVTEAAKRIGVSRGTLYNWIPELKKGTNPNE
jgi:predicted DNA-binding protein (UPF0251 family)